MSATSIAPLRPRVGWGWLSLIAGEDRVVRSYANPYVAGVGLGLVLLAAFVVMGRGLGASGAFASAAAEIATTFDSNAG